MCTCACACTHTHARTHAHTHTHTHARGRTHTHETQERMGLTKKTTTTKTTTETTKRRRGPKKERPTPAHLQGKMSLLKANRANKRMVDIAWTRAGHVPFFKKRGFQPAAVSAMLSDAGARVASKLAKFAPPGQKRSILPRMTSGAKRAYNYALAVVATEMAGRASTAGSVDVAMAKKEGKKKARVSGRLAAAACTSFVSSVGIPAVHARLRATSKTKPLTSQR